MTLQKYTLLNITTNHFYMSPIFFVFKSIISKKKSYFVLMLQFGHKLDSIERKQS